MEIFDSLEGVSRRLESLLDSGGGRVGAASGAARPLLVITGSYPPEQYWKRLAEKFDLAVELLE
jgi:hypothetical protein